jgi:hypothetical protein
VAYNDLVSELVGTVPKLSALHAGQLVNRAWSKVRDFRTWSFNIVADAQIFVPAIISTGTVSTTFGSQSIVVDATAGAALNAVVTANPPLAGTIGIGRQIRLGQASGLASPTGPNYTITAWNNSTRTITIDKPFGEDSVSGSAYQVLKCYYAAPGFPYTSPSTPDPGLVRFLSIVNRANGYALSGRNLNWSQEQLNSIDPQRGGQGDAYIQANYGRTATGLPVFELYPNPVGRVTYSAIYFTRWPNLSAAVDLPQMPYQLADLVMVGTKVLAAQWALANVVTFEELGKTNWVAYAGMMQTEFKDALIQCIKVDDEIMPGEVRRQGSLFSFPLGGSFAQSHDLSSLFP